MSHETPSWDYPVFLILYGVFYYLGGVFGWVLFCMAIIFCLWRGLSKNKYEQLHENYPQLERITYMANMLVFPVALPLLIISSYQIYLFISSP